jgi:hypothetical protein
VRSEEVDVPFGDAAGDIGGAHTLLGVVRNQCSDELPRRAAAILLREQALRLCAGGCQAPAGRLHQIFLHGRTSDHIALSMLLHQCQDMQWLPFPAESGRRALAVRCFCFCNAACGKFLQARGYFSSVKKKRFSRYLRWASYTSLREWPCCSCCDRQ